MSVPKGFESRYGDTGLRCLFCADVIDVRQAVGPEVGLTLGELAELHRGTCSARLSEAPAGHPVDCNCGLYLECQSADRMNEDFVMVVVFAAIFVVVAVVVLAFEGAL